jgi:hypothetical protein
MDDPSTTFGFEGSDERRVALFLAYKGQFPSCSKEAFNVVVAMWFDYTSFFSLF